MPRSSSETTKLQLTDDAFEHAERWTPVPPTLQAKTGVSGLTAGTVYFFRVQPLLRTGEQNWSSIASFMVK